jgi:hypothetical protein
MAMLTAVPAAGIEAAIRRAGHHNRLLGTSRVKASPSPADACVAST